jgi:hypothetical protein
MDGVKMGRQSLVSRLLVMVGITFVVLLVGTLGFAATEHVSLFDAAYFTIVTVTTVGYGDVHAQTVNGKILSIILIVVGVGTFSSVIVNSVGIFVQRLDETNRRRRASALVGLFYVEIGNALIKILLSADPGIDHLCRQAVVKEDWTETDFQRFRTRIVEHEYRIDYANIPLRELREALEGKTDILLRLFENPSLSEDWSLTEMLRATLHLRQELSLRGSLDDLPESDVRHLSEDSRRVYMQLSKGWLEYVRGLKTVHPYMFSLALRTNPFDDGCSPVVK